MTAWIWPRICRIECRLLIGDVNVFERVKGGSIKTPAVHRFTGRIAAMEQAQIHAGFLGTDAVKGCIAGLLRLDPVFNQKLIDVQKRTVTGDQCCVHM
jgi:hypothetical protein